MMPMKDSGIINKPSHHSVDETVEKLKSILRAKGIKLFTLIDHSGEAEKVGLKMRPTKVLIFGNPQAGTPLMLAAPRSAIDLPLKILIWQDDQEEVWISYNSPAYLQERHGFPAELLKTLQSSMPWRYRLVKSRQHETIASSTWCGGIGHPVVFGFRPRVDF
jgi:uncharacterized protein (DUF302 family)